ncbi:MAG: T9SS type A sorting domain-containing protein [Candidatus Marinimicrobia bacterium]|nr:T9SS type A sorting domain-containing protein [Candidatus Neomarinimicrobiota bacterium]
MYINKLKYFLSCSLLTLSLGQVDFNSDIQPILNAKCIQCHGSSAGLSLSSYDNLMAGSYNGAVINPYDHSSSELWLRVYSGQMPPGNNDMTSAEVDLVAQWIDEGALEEPGSSMGCTDPEAYNCADDDEWSTYIVDVGGVMYDNSCNWYWNTGTWEADYVGGCESGPCDGFYNPGATTDDGSCRYYQAPQGDEVIFEVESNGISIDWSAFTPPTNAVLESFHVQRCIVGCTWIEGFTLGDSNTGQNTFDEFDWQNEANGVQIKYAIAVKYESNPYWGWAIGASYITPEVSCSALGDLNGDGGYNVLDIVTLANCILAGNCAELENGCAGDLNGDGGYNVLDIVTLANCVLAGDCGGRIDDASEASLIKKDNIVSIEANGFIGGVQMTLNHDSDLSIEMTDRALFADYLTTDNETRLLVISPETEELFTYNGEFEITEIIVANSQYEVSVDLPIAASFSLSDAYPNPFNPVTTMTLTMPVSGDIKVEVYNLLGQVVATLASGYMEASTTPYTLTWDASNASSGVYFVQADAEGFKTTQKLMLIK